MWHPSRERQPATQQLRTALKQLLDSDSEDELDTRQAYAKVWDLIAQQKPWRQGVKSAKSTTQQRHKTAWRSSTRYVHTVDKEYKPNQSVDQPSSLEQRRTNSGLATQRTVSPATLEAETSTSTPNTHTGLLASPTTPASASFLTAATNLPQSVYSDARGPVRASPWTEVQVCSSLTPPKGLPCKELYPGESDEEHGPNAATPQAAGTPTTGRSVTRQPSSAAMTSAAAGALADITNTADRPSVGCCKLDQPCAHGNESVAWAHPSTTIREDDSQSAVPAAACVTANAAETSFSSAVVGSLDISTAVPCADAPSSNVDDQGKLRNLSGLDISLPPCSAAAPMAEPAAAGGDDTVQDLRACILDMGTARTHEVSPAQLKQDHSTAAEGGRVPDRDPSAQLAAQQSLHPTLTKTNGSASADSRLSDAIDECPEADALIKASSSKQNQGEQAVGPAVGPAVDPAVPQPQVPQQPLAVKQSQLDEQLPAAHEAGTSLAAPEHAVAVVQEAAAACGTPVAPPLPPLPVVGLSSAPQSRPKLRWQPLSAAQLANNAQSAARPTVWQEEGEELGKPLHLDFESLDHMFSHSPPMPDKQRQFHQGLPSVLAPQRALAVEVVLSQAKGVSSTDLAAAVAQLDVQTVQDDLAEKLLSTLPTDAERAALQQYLEGALNAAPTKAERWMVQTVRLGLAPSMLHMLQHKHSVRRASIDLFERVQDALDACEQVADSQLLQQIAAQVPGLGNVSDIASAEAALTALQTGHPLACEALRELLDPETRDVCQDAQCVTLRGIQQHLQQFVEAEAKVDKALREAEECAATADEHTLEHLQQYLTALQELAEDICTVRSNILEDTEQLHSLVERVFPTTNLSQRAKEPGASLALLVSCYGAALHM